MGETNFLAGKVIEVNGATAMVQTGAGVFEAALRPGCALRHAGDPCTLSIRPESWTLATQPPERNAIEGRITERIYLGEMAQYRFSAGPQTLKICELNPRFLELGPERQLFASVEPEGRGIVAGMSRCA